MINTFSELKIDFYSDANFSGMYGHDNSTDPECVKSRKGYAITIANLPVLWKSKLKTETSFLTMEAEII